MEKQIMYFNAEGFNRELSATKQFMVYAQQILDAHKGFGNLFQMSSISQVDDIMTDTNGAASAYMKLFSEKIDPPEVIPGIKMKRDEFVASLELPDFSVLNQIASKCRNDHNTSYRQIRLLKIEEGNVVLIQEQLDALQDSYTVFADTLIKQEILGAHVAAATALSKLNILLRKAGKLGVSKDCVFNRIFVVNDDEIKARTELYRGTWRITEEA